MEVDKNLIGRVANIARLKLKEEEIEEFESDMRGIFDMFSKIEEVKTEDELNPQPVEIKGVLREDKIEKSLSEEDTFKNTKHKESGFFKGPKIK